MLLVSSDASAKSPRRAPGTVTSTIAVALGPRLGRPHDQHALPCRHQAIRRFTTCTDNVAAARSMVVFDTLRASTRTGVLPLKLAE
jgi:hypothetical protein